MNTKKREKLGDLMLDIAKYIITAILISACFSGADEWKWYNFIYPIIAVALTIWIGLLLIDSKKGDGKQHKGEGL